MMRNAFPISAILLLLPLAAQAQTDDKAYCEQLIVPILRYVQTPYDRGGAPDIEISEAINQCRSGNPAKGIPVLERKLRSNGFTLPKRS
jgi:hypothetical protein